MRNDRKSVTFLPEIGSLKKKTQFNIMNKKGSMAISEEDEQSLSEGAGKKVDHIAK